MKKIITLLLILPTLLLAELANSQQKSQQKLFDPHSLCRSKNVWVDVEALFWKSSEDDLEYAVKSQSQTSVVNGRVETPDFGWDWGMRVGLGIKIPKDRWDIFLKYTYLQARANGSVSASGAQAVFPALEAPFGLPSSFFAEEAAFHWKAKLNIVDTELGRNCIIGKSLSIRPFMGVRGLLIDQNIHAHYSGGTAVPTGDVDLVHFENDFWGVGLRMGADSLWALGAGWGLYGNGAASLVAGNFDVHETEKLKNAGIERLNFKSDPSSVVAIAEIALGMQWDRLFFHNRYHLGFKLGWEFNVFFNQNRLVHFLNATNPGALSQSNGDLSFQGVTFGLRFDF